MTDKFKSEQKDIVEGFETMRRNDWVTRINRMVNALLNKEFGMMEIFKSLIFAALTLVALITVSAAFPTVNAFTYTSSYFEYVFVFVMLTVAIHVVRVIR